MLQEFFHSFPTWALLLSIVVSILILGVSADKMVDGAASLARYTGLSPLVIGATIISLGTTMPEMVVSVFAAFYGDSSLALGNGVGSIIADTALIMGLLVLCGRVVLERRSISNVSWWRDLSASALVLAAFLFPQNILPRWFGFILLALLVVFLLQTYFQQVHIKQQEGSSIALNEAASGSGGHSLEDGDESEQLSLARSLLYLLAGLALVVGSSRVLLPQVQLFALRLGVSKDIIATTLVAFGTSLPELTTALAAIRKKKEALGVGNIMGADILNALFVVGAATATNPIRVEPAFFRIHFPVMLFVLWTLRLVFLGQLRKREGRNRNQWTIPKWYGLFLLIVYASYILLQYLGGVKHI
ncbi:sodium:calcium antiporter [Candidatus Haliotispira prima]|uniref:Sodium:calcium antiporter n=1 Tax=Candidatus Haliotispira prima TaxID=3034016 RepID=A0ABY8MDR1_9SPIO|nr:sodium:calcium antiporter [Candidatus Haliotispira prima]